MNPHVVEQSRLELAPRLVEIEARLGEVNAARERGLAACRRAIRAAGGTIRAVHRGQAERRETLLAECQAAIVEAQDALRPYPAVYFAGFLHDAEKEYAEARLTIALVEGRPIPGADELAVQLPAWLNGLAEAASELRRNLLDRLRQGETARAEYLLGAMEEAYELVVSIDFPDAVTGGLRRTADALRAVLERTRSDLTTTMLQVRLQAALEARLPAESSGSAGPGEAAGPSERSGRAAASGDADGLSS